MTKFEPRAAIVPQRPPIPGPRRRRRGNPFDILISEFLRHSGFGIRQSHLGISN